MFAGIVVLISGFRCFFVIDLANCLEVREKSGNFSASDEWQPCQHSN